MLHVVAPALRGPVPFTAGDLIEGLGFMEPVYRRAVVFGLEQKMPIAELISLTHREAAGMELGPFGIETLKQQPRHFRLGYVFWDQLDDGMVIPLLHLEQLVRQSFGGMSWDDLQSAYNRMVWVDDQIEAEHFMMVARQEGAWA